MKNLEPTNDFMTPMLTDSPVFEIAPGMTAEEMTATFFNGKALKLAPERVYRINSGGARYYYVFNEQGEPLFFPSVTTFIKELTPTSEHLIKWIADMGYVEAMKYVAYRAAYGTFMHGQYGEMTINRKYNLDGLKGALKSYIDSEQLPASFIDEADELRKDLLAYAQFMNDVQLEPLAVELVLVSRRLGFAGGIDLPCMITYKGERFRALVDFKSGRKGFYRDNVIQLHAYKDLWNENFPEFPIERVFNFAPKDWRKRPSYTFVEQTKDEAALDLPYLYGMARNHNKEREREFVYCHGMIEIGTDLDKNFTVLTLSETVKKRTEENKPSEAVDAAAGVEAEKPAETPVPKKRGKATPAAEDGVKPAKARKAPAKKQTSAKGPKKPKKYLADKIREEKAGRPEPEPGTTVKTCTKITDLKGFGDF